MRKRILVALVTLAVALFGAEVFVRLRFADEVDTERLRASRERVHLAAFTRPSRDPGVGFELDPGVDVEWNGTRVRVHPREPRRVPPGWEEADDAVGAGERAIRLAVVGDSTPFGWGVAYDEGYCARLRRLLEESSGRPVELRNYATPGYNSRQNRLAYERHARAWKPHVLLVHYDPNDAAPNPEDPGRMAPEFGDNPLHSALWKLLRRRVRRAAELEDDTTDPAAAEPDQLFFGFRVAGPDYDRHLEELRLLGEAAGEDGAAALVLVFNAGLVRAEPDAGAAPEAVAGAAPGGRLTRRQRDEGFRRLIHEPLRRRLPTFGYEVLDLYGPAQELMRERGWDTLRPLWLSKEDNHPSARGHAFLAALVHEALTTREPFRLLFSE